MARLALNAGGGPGSDAAATAAEPGAGSFLRSRDELRGTACAQARVTNTSRMLNAESTKGVKLDFCSFGCTRLPLRWVYEPRNANAHPVQGDHWRSENHHAADVRSGRESSSNNEDAKNGVTDVPPHPSCTYDSHQGQEKDQDGHLENQSESENHCQEQVGVFVDRDHRRELPAYADEEIERRGVHQAIAKIAAGHEQEDRRHHERDDVLLFPAIQSRGDKKPYLIEDVGRRYKQTRQRANLQVKIEGFGGIQIDQLLRLSFGLQHLDNGVGHKRDQAFADDPANRHTAGDCPQGVEDSGSKLLQVLEEAHRRHLFRFGLGWLDGGGSFRHWWCYERPDLLPTKPARVARVPAARRSGWRLSIPTAVAAVKSSAPVPVSAGAPDIPAG